MQFVVTPVCFNNSCMNLDSADDVALVSLLLLATNVLDSVLMRWPFKAHFYAVSLII